MKKLPILVSIIIILSILAGIPVLAETSLNVATPQSDGPRQLEQPGGQSASNQQPAGLSKRNKEKIKLADETKKRRAEITTKKAAEAAQQ